MLLTSSGLSPRAVVVPHGSLTSLSKVDAANELVMESVVSSTAVILAESLFLIPRSWLWRLCVMLSKELGRFAELPSSTIQMWVRCGKVNVLWKVVAQNCGADE